MGSYNLTCFSSNQVINEGQKVRLFGIKQSTTFRPVRLTKNGETVSRFGSSNTICGPNAYWTFVAPSISATYRDSGHFDFDLSGLNKWAAVYLICEIFNLSFVAEQGENSAREPKFDFKAQVQQRSSSLFEILSSNNKLRLSYSNKEWEQVPDEEIKDILTYLIDSVKDHRVFMLTHFEAIVPFQFAVVSQISFDSFISVQELYDSDFSEAVSRTSAVANAIKEAHSFVLNRDKSEDTSDATRSNLFDKSCFFRGLFDTLFRGASGGSEQGAPYVDLLFEYADAVCCSKSMTDEQLAEKLFPLISDKYFFDSLFEFNLPFIPFMYAGQDFFNDRGAAYAELVSGISKEMTNDINYARYGAPVEYELVLSLVDSLILDEFIENMSDDGYIEIISKTLLDGGAGNLRVKFKTPFEIEDVRLVCSNSFKQFEISQVQG